ncbi:uncharacterized protein LOC106152915 [Lingula anatina]|uniref:Uncharacterized protein LOC106152915 n=1 Tax=Lingula anatina TaxID=7574 RepID=A0A1S3H805_LINAN|nr:uncharacterized protein LOC106152915 [Lingula anatina]|eukprot:XP_013382112.1 uncharacterized protein LOC106152915 [Lingula anatina]
METKTKLCIGVFPVLCAVAWIYLPFTRNPSLDPPYTSTEVHLNTDTTPSGETPLPRGHMQRFGLHVEKETEIVELDHFPDPETFYKDYVYPSVPVIVRGGLKHWPAMEKWKNEEYLKEKFGHCLYTIRKKVVDEHHPAEMLMSLADFLDAYRKEKLYLTAYICPEMTQDFSMPSCIGCDAYVKMILDMILFFNTGWTNTEVHIDPYEIFYTQIRGKRQWILTPPSDGKYLHTEEFPYHAGMCPADVDAVDLIKYPNISKAAIYNVTINEGDMLYVPEAWFHQVRTTEGDTNMGLALYLNHTSCITRCPDTDDIEFLENCMEARKQTPKEITCNERTDNIPYSAVVEKYKDIYPRLLIHEEKQTEMKTSVTTLLQSGHSMPVQGLSLTRLGKEQLGTTVRHALLLGYRLFLTDPDDDSEDALGSILADNQHCKREDVFVVVKLDSTLEGDAVRKSIKRSMERLKTDYVDLVLFRAPICDKDQEGCEARPGGWEILEELHDAGTIRSLGLSGFKISQVQRLVASAKIRVSVVHAKFDITYRNTELRDFCNQHGMRFMARNFFGPQKLKELVLSSEMIKIAARLFRTDTSTTIIRWALNKNITVITPATDLRQMAFNRRALFFDVAPGSYLDDLDNFPHKA